VNGVCVREDVSVGEIVTDGVTETIGVTVGVGLALTEGVIVIVGVGTNGCWLICNSTTLMTPWSTVNPTRSAT